MKILIKGKNIVPHVQTLDDEEAVLAYYLIVKDAAPLGEESNDNFTRRNQQLLDALLIAFKDHDGDDESIICYS